MERIHGKTIRVWGMVLMFAMFLGCGRTSVDKIKNPEAAVKKYLNKKYGKEFEIYNMEKVDIGQNFAKYIYEGTAGVQEENGKVFEFTIIDANTIKDNYPMTLFEEQIQQDVEMILEDERIKVQELRLEYMQKTEAFLDYKAFKENQNVIIHCNIESATESEEGIRAVYRILEELKNEGYYLYVSVNSFGIKEYIIYSNNIQMLSEDAFIKRFIK